jgi:hypothetical protein
MALEGFEFGFGAMSGGAVAAFIIYMLVVLLPGPSKKGRG